MLFHQGEQGPHYLAEHRPQRRRRIFGIMKLHPEIGLADLESVGDGLRGHPNVNTETRAMRPPNVVREAGLDRSAPPCVVSADGLTHPFPAAGPREVVGDSVRAGAVIVVARR